MAFAAVCLALWARYRTDRPARLLPAAPPWPVPYLAVQTLLSVAVIVCLGEAGLATLPYLSSLFALVCPLRVALPVAVALVLGVITSGALDGWGNQLSTAFAVLAATLAVLGLRGVLHRDQDLRAAGQENTKLAVDNERIRFSRDLHDILGHSLTVITVKSELAQKLLDIDLERARTEVADLERLSRDALTDVRRAVEGYRDITLPGELVRARMALRAAEIHAELPHSADEVPSDLRELFAWTIREGVTNVIRHSGAAHCWIKLTATSAEVIDDGTNKPSPDGRGSGLTGLRERAAEVGARVEIRELSPGYSLSVVRS